MKELLEVDTSLSCKIRTSSVELTAKTGSALERQQLPATPMPGRRLVRVLNFGVFGEFPDPDPTLLPILHIMVGGQDVRWASVSDFSGISLRVYESLEFLVDESVPIFAVLSPTIDPTEETVDVRVLEIG